MSLSIDITESHIVLRDISDLSSNRRFKMSIQRLNGIAVEGDLHIPFTSNEKESKLKEVIDLLQKFTDDYSLTDNTNEEVQTYVDEEKHFVSFSQKAKQIRNDEFNEIPELVEDFKRFKSSLEENMSRRLYDFQMLSAFHLAFSQNGCNFAVPGAGKTSIVYGAYTYLKHLPKDHPQYIEKLLVVGPLASFGPWENEFEACFGKRPDSQRIFGEVDKEIRKGHFYSGNPAELTIISHAGVTPLVDDIKDFLRRYRTMIVVDEAHRIKNPDGVWSNSVLEISKEAKSRVILTGTPVPNGYEDIYNLYKFIYPFKYKDILQMHVGNLVEMTKNDDHNSDRVKDFIERISPYFIRIKKSDLKLPPIEEKTVLVEMDDVQRRIYDFIESKYVLSFQKDLNAATKDILNKAKLIRLRQASSNPSLLLKPLKESLEHGETNWDSDPNSDLVNVDIGYDDPSLLGQIESFSRSNIPSKFIKIKEIVDEMLQRNEKVIIWTIFIQNSKELMAYLQESGIGSRLLIGEVPQEEREIVIRKFNDPLNKDFSVVIANPFSVSESISLHKGCHNAIYLERDYNCAMFLQSKDRIHRVGLDKDQITKYFYIVSTDSIDTIINVRLDEKAERMSKVIDSDIPLLAKLDDNNESDIILDLLRDYAKRS